MRTKVDQLTRKLDQLLANSSRIPVGRVCELCASPAHCVSDCLAAPLYPEFVQEQVNAAQGFARTEHDSFAPPYNPGWRNQFISPSHQPSQTQYRHSNPSQGYLHPIFSQVHPQSSLPSLQEPIPSSSFQEKMLEAFSDIKATLCSHTQSIAKLETQMGQLAQTLTRQSQGNRHSQSVVTSKGEDFMSFDLQPTYSHLVQVKSFISLQYGKACHSTWESTQDPHNISTDESISMIPQQKGPGTQHALSSHIHKAPFSQLLGSPIVFSKQEVQMQKVLDQVKPDHIHHLSEVAFIDTRSVLDSHFLTSLSDETNVRSSCRGSHDITFRRRRDGNTVRSVTDDTLFFIEPH